MPIYEFSCQSCGAQFEHMQSFSVTTFPACPSCHSILVERKLSRPAIHFKGSGWYITDSKNSDKRGAIGGSSSSSAKEDKAAGDAAPAAEKTGSDSKESKESAGGSEKAAPAPAPAKAGASES